jgi:hypothetical protein
MTRRNKRTPWADQSSPPNHDLCAKVRGHYFDVMRHEVSGQWSIRGPTPTAGAYHEAGRFIIETGSTDREIARIRAEQWIAEFKKGGAP